MRNLLGSIASAILIIALGLCVSIAASNSNFFAEFFREDGVEHLGSEYDQIAIAMRHGRGFSDPFSRPTGPTAWMPPAIPSLLAVLYRLTGDDRASVVRLFFGIQMVAICVCMVPPIFIAFQLRIPMMGVGICAGVVAAYFHELFRLTHDHGIQMLAILLVWMTLSWSIFAEVPLRRSLAVVTGCVGGAVALVSPAIGFAWALNVANRLKGSPASLLIAASVSIATVAPWTLRNYFVLGQLVPIKSNFDYEFWQANVVDTDGLIDSETFRIHPAVRPYGPEGEQYANLGEAAFLAQKRIEWRHSLAQSINGFVGRVVRRALATFLIYEPSSLSEYDGIGSIFIALKSVWKPLPTISLLFITWRYQRRIPRVVATAASIWIVVIAPYVLTSYYERYAWPTLPMQMIVVVFALRILLHDAGRARIGILAWHRRTTKPTDCT